MQLTEFGLGLIIVGVFVLLLTAVLMSSKPRSKGKVEAAGVIMIGPVPIIFGTNKAVKTILVLSIVLVALLIAAMLVYNFVLR